MFNIAKNVFDNHRISVKYHQQAFENSFFIIHVVS